MITVISIAAFTCWFYDESDWWSGIYPSERTAWITGVPRSKQRYVSSTLDQIGARSLQSEHGGLRCEVPTVNRITELTFRQAQSFGQDRDIGPAGYTLDHVVQVAEDHGAGDSSDTSPAWFPFVQGEWRAHDPAWQTKCEQFIFADAPFTAQFQQDWFLFHNFFKHLGAGYKGTYVDVGSNDPFKLSNTAFFDKCLGWRGVCVEPQPEYATATRLQRSCQFFPNCVWNSRKSVDMKAQGAASHVLNSMESSQMRMMQDPDHQLVPVQCLPLQNILVQAHVQTIDFLSVDIEGSEMEAMTSFPFNRFNIRVMMVETIHLPDPRQFDLMTQLGGFNKVANLGVDDIYERKVFPMHVPPNYCTSQFEHDLFRRSIKRKRRC